MSIEVESNDEFMELFLVLLNDHDNTKMVSSIDNHGQPLDGFKMSWNATIAEEQGFDPIFAMLSPHVPYFIMFSKRTGLTGYQYFHPLNH